VKEIFPTAYFGSVAYFSALVKLETVGDLRELIKANNGVLNIGTLTFKFDSDLKGDIDVNHRGSLVMWISKGVGNAESLDSTETYSTTGVFDDKTEEPDPQIEIDRLNAEVRKLKKENVEASLAVGKVEAYEKLLIGRELTIGR
jgi:hypothetical protein